ncbi:MAG: tocopherol cyclase family protein [Saprospiraceae bacterium]
MNLKDWKNRQKAIWHPDMYHGWGKTHNYFEGWYFKIVDPTEQYAFALIPGISLGKDGTQHAFIQSLDGKQRRTAYHEFTAAEFQPAADRFALQLGNNFFSVNRMKLDLPELKGEVAFSNLHPWPKMLGAPGIMGWYSFVPFMQCYHGVVSVDHNISGSLEVNGKTVSFDGGKGYIEKDWGRSFPSSWIWMQTNHFGQDMPISLMASVARIPWLGNHFVGYIVGFLYKNKIHRFATYTGAKMKAEIVNDQVKLSFKDSRYRLEITAERTDGGNLISPIDGNMVGKVNESLQSEIYVTFYERESLIFEGTGRNAGMEVAGEVEEELLTEKWRR